MACNFAFHGNWLVPSCAPTVSPSVPAETKTTTLAPPTILEVPATKIELEGKAHLSYQIAGDPFRFICPDSCAVNPKLMAAQYSGFRVAEKAMVALTGIDILGEIQPVDIHVLNDSQCGTLGNSPALSFAGIHKGENAYICTFLFGYIKGFNNQPYQPEDALRLDQQTIILHEYLHTFFFGRIINQAGAMHDFVAPSQCTWRAIKKMHLLLVYIIRRRRRVITGDIFYENYVHGMGCEWRIPKIIYKIGYPI
jgi:hypothetical protein